MASQKFLHDVLPLLAASFPVPVIVDEPEPDRPRSLQMQYFAFEKLDVYQAALEFVVVVDEIVEALPPGRSYLSEPGDRPGTVASTREACRPKAVETLAR